MSCCSNPQIESSTYTDWCTSCGWVFSYLSNTESQDDDVIEWGDD